MAIPGETQVDWISCNRLTSTSVFECLRVWAISDKSWILSITVLALGLTAPAIDLVNTHIIDCSIVADFIK